MKLVLATRNADKVKEIRAILSGLDVDIVTVDDSVPDVVEDRDTLEGNALKKAQEVREHTGCASLADDTGLEVDALDGAPGVYSARYAGEDVTYADNNAKLLQDMVQTPDDHRAARFRCVMALALSEDDVARLSPAADSGTDALISEGILPGRIARSNRGDNGFGYDPLFEVEENGRTLAEMSADEKNRVSHRYRALLEMREMLLRYGLAQETTTE